MKVSSIALVVIAIAASASPALAVPASATNGGSERTRTTDSASSARRAQPTEHAPGGTPLVSTADPGGLADRAEDGSASSSEADPLVSNGLGSPICRWAHGQELPAASRRDCETSGFAAAGAPTGHYGIDVHIDTGLFGLSSNSLLSATQELLIAPLWMALVWAVHALVVMLEWSFTIDLLDSADAGGLASGLRRAQAALTMPWLPLALAISSIAVLYNGLVRRRVADTLGDALMLVAMIAGGLWVMLDPTGTVGALGRWANQASLGTLAVTARGHAAVPSRALAESMSGLFSEAIESPWCYLEFGDVAWCRDPSRLDPALHAAGLKIAAAEVELIGCRKPGENCVASNGKQAQVLTHVAELLRGADSNAATFLALPANGAARNSINEQGSLLRAICQSDDASDCRGSAAAQAEFRTAASTWSRLGGLLLIVGGLLGMLLLLGFIVLRLLTASLFCVFYLLLAPALVLAPAFGEAGRAAFRAWAARLLGAVVSKLLFSFLLGTVLAVLAILSDLDSLGWWTQWLLTSAFWWGAYVRRHQLIELSGGAMRGEQAQRMPVSRRIGRLIDAGTGVAASRVRRRERKMAPQADTRASSKGAPGRPSTGRLAPAGVDHQARRMLEVETRAARESDEATAEQAQRRSAGRAQLERVRLAREQAIAAGDPRRSAELDHRGQRIAAEIERDGEALTPPRLEGARQARRREVGSAQPYASVDEYARLLDAQARLASASAATRHGQCQGRDYAALAPLIGYKREEFARLSPRDARKARLEIDGELAWRSEHGRVLTSEPLGSPQRESQAAVARSSPPAREKRARHSGRSDQGAGDGLRAAHGSTEGGESSVLRDAREVAARRKRQLGVGRP